LRWLQSLLVDVIHEIRVEVDEQRLANAVRDAEQEGDASP
jgi:hypothetical protein